MAIDFDVEENQDALRQLYEAIHKHQLFWVNWVFMRVGPMGDTFAAPEEAKAAKNMADALEQLAKLGRENLEEF